MSVSGGDKVSDFIYSHACGCCLRWLRYNFNVNCLIRSEHNCLDGGAGDGGGGEKFCVIE